MDTIAFMTIKNTKDDKLKLINNGRKGNKEKWKNKMFPL